jgi:glutamate carboxypeptidase
MHVRPILLAVGLAIASLAQAQPRPEILELAGAQKQPFLATVKSLVEIESGSADREGLDRIADVVAAKFRALGGQVELIDTPEADIVRGPGTPAKPGKVVRATFHGKGTKKILLLAHMDTVYQRGDLARQPFRIEGDKAYGLAISDDKQGIAVVAHAIALLQALKFDEFGTLTAVINADEEVGSPASQKLITAMGAAHDVTLSFEASGITNDRLSLTTAGIGGVQLKVTGKASHAGSAPQNGINALYEVANQVLQLRDLSDPATGSKLNWTLAKAGSVSNVIPEFAQAEADVRVLRVSDYDAIEKKLAERVGRNPITNAKVEYTFFRGRPPLVLTEGARKLAQHSQAIYREIGQDLKVEDTALGGGTDAAFAALATKNPVVERYGLRGAGGHSAIAESIAVDNIEPRLYLVARTIMDLSRARVKFD